MICTAVLLGLSRHFVISQQLGALRLYCCSFLVHFVTNHVHVAVRLKCWVGSLPPIVFRRCARRFPFVCGCASFVPSSVGMHPRPKGSARYRSWPRMHGSTLTMPSSISIPLVINNTANSLVRNNRAARK